MNKWYLLFSLMVFCSILPGQTTLCGGNIGDNLFDDGDFGSGTPNIFPANPNIAPGYAYLFTPPPNDNMY